MKDSGLFHITAMSGYNLVVLSSAVYRFLNFFPINFFLANILAILSILIFIIFAGFQSSVIRAGIMMIIFILSKLIGRPSLQRNIIILAALLITIFDPLALIKDLGFQLSILATTGIIYFEEYLRKFFKLKTISETISAQVIVLPFLWYKFGEFNLFSFVNNSLLLPFIPYLMLIGFLALLFFFIYPLNQIFNLPFEIFSLIVSFLANLPKIYLPLPLILVIFLYLFIIYFIFKINKNERIDFNFSLR